MVRIAGIRKSIAEGVFAFCPAIEMYLLQLTEER